MRDESAGLAVAVTGHLIAGMSGLALEGQLERRRDARSSDGCEYGSGSVLDSGTVRFVATRNRLRSMNSPSSGKRSERWHTNTAEVVQPTGSVEPKVDERNRSAGVVYRAQQAHLAVQDTQLCERPDHLTSVSVAAPG